MTNKSQDIISFQDPNVKFQKGIVLQQPLGPPSQQGPFKRYTELLLQNFHPEAESTPKLVHKFQGRQKLHQ